MENQLKSKIESVREITDLTIPELVVLRQEIKEIIAKKAVEEYVHGTLVSINDRDPDEHWVVVAIQNHYEEPRLVIYPLGRISSSTEVVTYDRVSMVVK